MVEYTGPSSGGGHAGVAPGMRKSGPGGAGRGEGGGSPVVSTLATLPGATAAVTCHQPHN